MIKIGVVGAGHLGRWHIKNLKALETVDLIGFYDVDPERRAVIAAEYGVASFDSLVALLEQCDAVSIVVPTRSHYAVARAALDHNRHVFCEKPFMQTLAEADEIIALAKQKGLVLQVGHIERFNPALAGIGDFPIKPLFIESHRISPFNPRGTDVAVILDLMIHDIDIVLSLVTSELAQIDASGAPVLTDTIDIANARLKFTNGCVANITASRVSSKQMRKLRIFQKEAYLSIDFLKNQTNIYSLVHTPDEVTAGAVPVAELKINDRQTRLITYREIHTTESNALLAELRAFSRSIIEGTPPPVTGADGKRALEIALQIEKLVQASLRKVINHDAA